MNQILKQTEKFVREQLANAEKGHDFYHAQRVVRLAAYLQAKEGGNRKIILLAAWLHDIADAKFHQGDETLGPALARDFLRRQQLGKEAIDKIIEIIENISFRKNASASKPGFLELHIVRDADRLDALGAIGIARTFHYGGYKNNPIFDPDTPLTPLLPEDYAKSNQNRSTIHHFYDKLLKLKDLLHTQTAKELAERKHYFMEKFLEEFFYEWNFNSKPINPK